MPNYQINLRLVEGKVVLSPGSIRCNPLDTLEFASQDGDVNIIFDPPEAVQLTPPGFSRVTVNRVPFAFRCRLKLPNGSEVGWGGDGRWEPEDAEVRTHQRSVNFCQGVCPWDPGRT